MDEQRFRQAAFKAVVDYFNSNVDYTDKFQITDKDVYIVWQVKALQNNKALLSTNIPDGMYYEFTWNGDDDVGYLDAYKKVGRSILKGDDL